MVAHGSSLGMVVNYFTLWTCRVLMVVVGNNVAPFRSVLSHLDDLCVSSVSYHCLYAVHEPKYFPSSGSCAFNESEKAVFEQTFASQDTAAISKLSLPVCFH